MTCPVCQGNDARDYRKRADGAFVYYHPDGDFCVQEQPRDRAARLAAIDDRERTPITTRLEATIAEYEAAWVDAGTFRRILKTFRVSPEDLQGVT